MRHTTSRLGLTIQYAIVCIAMLCFIFPIVWMVLTSLKTQNDAFTVVPKWIFAVTWENYRTVLLDRNFSVFLWNSFFVSAVSTVLAVILGCGIAYPYARYNLKGGQKVLTWILTLRIIPPIVSILPVYLVFSKLGMLDSYSALILMYTFMNLPLVTWLLYGFFKDIPNEIEESALVDGNTRFTAFFRVIFPIIGPGLVSAGLLSFIFAWNEFLFANILSGPHVRTAPVGLNEYATPVSVLWGQIAAAGTMIIIPIAVITLILQRKMVSGLTMGAVKG